MNASGIHVSPRWHPARYACLLGALCTVACFAGEDRAGPLTEIYRFTELMARSETIAVCEVRSVHVGTARLRVVNWLKGPPADAERWLQEARAKARLDTETRKADPQAKPETDPELDLEIDVIAPFQPPDPGTQNLYFLWDRIEPTKELPLRYRVAHPQCVYEAQYAAEVKTELSRARNAPRRPYLRAWDAKMAVRLAQQAQTSTLLQLKPGHSEKGLRMAVRFVKPSMLSPGSFDLSVRIENLMEAEQAIYDGPLPVFGVRLRPKEVPAEKALVLMAVDEGLTGGPDADVLAMTDVNDFIGVPKRDQVIKTLHFGVREHPELAKLQGEFLASAFYISAQDGKGLEDLPGVPWVGTLVTEEMPVAFAPPAKP